MIAPTRNDPLDRITRVLVERFRPQRVALFGSRARGDAHEGSDYDIMVVVEDASEKGLEVLRREVVAGESVDIIVRDARGFEEDRDDVGTMVYAVEHEGRILYGPPLSPRVVREPRPGAPRSLALWQRRADNDFHAMELGARDTAPPWDTVCFHAHQGVEKLLKCALIAAGTPPPREHDVLKLLALCPAGIRDNEELQHCCRVLSEAWPKTRYPEGPEPTPEEGAEAVERARSARVALMRHLKISR
jgi:HEPN domain-containing protein/predicted nucleotidyltransferase